VSSLIVLALWANASPAAAPCQGLPLEVPFAFEGAWAGEDEAWISHELLTWFEAHGREGCSPSGAQERLVLFRDETTVAVQLRKNARVVGERTVTLEAVPLEGRNYTIAALAEELARSMWERPVRRELAVGAVATSRILFSGAKLFGGGAALGWSPLEGLTFELGVTAAANPAVRATNGNTGGAAVWGELGVRYGVPLGPFVLGPRLGLDLGRLFLWGVDDVGLRREGGAWWVVGRGGVFLGLERDRWAVRLNASMGRTLAGAIILDAGSRAQVFDGATGELGLVAEVRF